MEGSSFFLSLVLILLSARLFGEVAVWLKTPSVMGEILAGIILGPSLLGWVEPTDTIRLLAEFGLILLLFEVGLDADISELMTNKKKASIVAIGGFVAPFISGFAISYYLFDLSLLISLFIGGTLTATSIGVTLRVLRDLERQHSHEAHVVLGAAVLDDILGVVLLAVLFEFSVHGEVSLINASKVFIFIMIFFALAPIVAKLMGYGVSHAEKFSHIPGLLPTMIVSLVLFFAWLSHTVGAPELLGGFAAGLALSRRFFLPFSAILAQTDGDFVKDIESKMKPIIQLFTPIFFVMVGLSLNLQEVNWSAEAVWKMTLIFILLALASKMAGAWLIREPTCSRIAIGIAMIPRAEVGLVFAELGRISGVFDNDLYAVMILTIAATTILPPFMMKYFYGRYGHLLSSAGSGNNPGA
ncbi:MAG: cation:proton antiporter [Mariprofundaceae bacterium]|nr:cation:proton antiporter [Mariprofundaceae bacterium]